MFGISQSQGTVLWPGPINESDVFVSIGDAMDVKKAGSNQSAGAGFRGGWAFAEEFDVKTAFLLRFTNGGDLWVLIQFDMPAERQPFIQLAMMDQQDFAVADNKDRHGEINFFVYVRHTGLTLASGGRRVKLWM